MSAAGHSVETISSTASEPSAICLASIKVFGTVAVAGNIFEAVGINRKAQQSNYNL